MAPKPIITIKKNTYEIQLAATNTDLRAALASGTVKKRINTCGKPAVPNNRPKPNEIDSMGLLTNLPGDKIDSCLLWAATADLNKFSKLKPTWFITIRAMKVAPDINKIALIICTQVVASIPPNNT